MNLRNQRRLLGALCICIVGGMLVAGLWPFHQPANGVHWLENEDGVEISRYGTLQAERSFNSDPADGQAPCTIEVRIQPAKIDRGGTVLAFSSPAHLVTFSLRQVDTDLLIQTRHSNEQSRIVTSELSVDDVLRAGRPILVAISSGARGTVVYLDGAPVESSRRFRVFEADLVGQLVVGTSPIENDNWIGRIRGIAIYPSEYTANEAARDYREWKANRRPDTLRPQGVRALYLFDEHSGSVVRDYGPSAVRLRIPERYSIVDEKFLEPAWQEFNLHWGYWESALINIAGFIPFGFFVFAFLSIGKAHDRFALWTVLLGTALSLTIEVTQSFLPTRDSGTTDLITNTLGTALGVALYRWQPKILPEALRRISVLLQPRRNSAPEFD